MPVIDVVAAPQVTRRRGFVSPRDVPALAAATVLVVIVDLALRSLGLQRAARILRVPVLLVPAGSDDADTAFDLRPAERRRVRAVARVVRALFGLDRGCLRFALATAVLLRGHRPGIRLGVARVDGAVLAHAWVEIAGRTIRAGNHVPLQAA